MVVAVVITDHNRITSQQVSYAAIKNHHHFTSSQHHVYSALTHFPLVLVHSSKTISSFLYVPLNFPDHSMCHGQLDVDFSKAGSFIATIVTPKVNRLNLSPSSSINISYILRCPTPIRGCCYVIGQLIAFNPPVLTQTH
jgi:hypothetical protein